MKQLQTPGRDKRPLPYLRKIAKIRRFREGRACPVRNREGFAITSMVIVLFGINFNLSLADFFEQSCKIRVESSCDFAQPLNNAWLKPCAAMLFSSFT